MKWSTLSLTALAMVAAACQPKSEVQPKRAGSSLCSSVKEPYVCIVPFEVIYSDRDTLEGRVISVDGVIGAGIHQEPPGSKDPIFVLFSSRERAQACTAALALELIPEPIDMERRLQQYSGEIATVTGILRRGDSPRFWARLEVTGVSVPLTGPKEEIDCLSERPPNPP
jgi:hypothetical protein